MQSSLPSKVQASKAESQYPLGSSKMATLDKTAETLQQTGKQCVPRSRHVYNSLRGWFLTGLFLWNLGVSAEERPPIPEEWTAYLENLVPVGEAISPHFPNTRDPLLRQELYSKMFSEIAAGYVGLLYANSRHPDFWPVLNPAFNNVGVPNPDNVYYVTPIDDDGVYKVSGYRGSVRIVNFQLGKDSLLARGEGSWGPTLANYDLDDGIAFDEDGEFEIIISSKRPDGYEGDWWRLPEGATYLLVRQTAYDWLNEVDARLAIDRLDVAAAKPRPTAQEIRENLKHIAVWVENYMTRTLQGPKNLKEAGLVNDVVVRDLSHIAGMKSQVYSDTVFDLTSEEALILEIDMPRQCRYWNYQLADEMWGSLDYMHNQTSLNGFTAKQDADGKVRIVVSSKDPGVPNWLDTLGYRKGVALGRWERCDKPPAIKIDKVAIENVRRHLPEETAVVTPEARAESIRLRRKGAQLRRRW